MSSLSAVERIETGGQWLRIIPDEIENVVWVGAIGSFWRVSKTDPGDLDFVVAMTTEIKSFLDQVEQQEHIAEVLKSKAPETLKPFKLHIGIIPHHLDNPLVQFPNVDMLFEFMNAKDISGNKPTYLLELRERYPHLAY